MAKKLTVTGVAKDDVTGATMITFNAEENEKDLQFKLIQSEDMTELGVAVFSFGCVIIPGSVTEAASMPLEVELTGSFSGLYTATYTLANIAQVGTSVNMVAVE